MKQDGNCAAEAAKPIGSSRTARFFVKLETTTSFIPTRAFCKPTERRVEKCTQKT